MTGSELELLGELGPCELVPGRVVPMSTAGDEHGAIEANLGAMLHSFVKARKLGKVRVGEVGIYTLRDPDTIRAADILYISNERHSRLQSGSFLDVAPELVVEILSPGDRWSEVMEKLREYFTGGVQLVWIINPRSRSVFVYRSLTDVHELPEGSELDGGEVLPGFTVTVSEIFED